MKFYIKNINTNEIEELYGENIWLREKPDDIDLNDYFCDRYIKTLSRNMRSFYLVSSKDDFDLQELKKLKEQKIIQLKKNRDLSLQEPMSSIKALEYGTSNEVYFEFQTRSTGNSLTEPSTIIFRALGYQSVKYSCKIIEGEEKRQGYVEITKEVAENLSGHLQLRATTNIQYANDLEAEINDESCDSLEKLNNIDINFTKNDLEAEINDESCDSLEKLNNIDINFTKNG